jgi:hypothetical protein
MDNVGIYPQPGIKRLNLIRERTGNIPLSGDSTGRHLKISAGRHKRAGKKRRIIACYPL